MKKIIDLNNYSNKQLLAFFITCLLLFMFLTFVFSNFRSNEYKYDYENGNIYSILIDFNETNDRDVYWRLESIISKLISSYKDDEQEDLKNGKIYAKDSIKNYYNALECDYQRFLGKSKFNKKITEFFTKISSVKNNMLEIRDENFIEAVYKKDNAYICKIYSPNNQNAYLGINLRDGSNRYTIFYIE